MDRFFRGLVSGMIGGVIMNAWSFFSYHVLHFTSLRFVDWMSVLVYGYLPQNIVQTLYALLLHLIWMGFLGVIFAYLLPIWTSKGYLIKGVFYAILVGIIIYALPTLYRTPHLTALPFNTVLSNHTGGFLWGLTLAQTLHWLENFKAAN